MAAGAAAGSGFGDAPTVMSPPTAAQFTTVALAAAVMSLLASAHALTCRSAADAAASDPPKGHLATSATSKAPTAPITAIVI
ncbi:MAG: hypothetical protein A3E01_18835 [Gammaproteobacteria bacterium RIFCSPHIGHO2_12_FULL_63_22]|nr:MAG: hypothetical protein A3E01_18835 [Gammaproteobacteria bacterium RIFCSPHIGHO2_12_FULL_63_22]